MKQSWKPGTMIYPLPAVLVSVGATEDEYNLFTVAWTGTVCTNPPMAYISVRPERHSYQMIRESGEFVVNLTTEALAKATDYCGVRSGRDVDKIQELSLTLEDSEVISVPGLKELPLTLECKVIYKQAQDLSKLETSYKEKYYSDDIPGDYHIAYYGEIVNAYIVE
mgnify:CR=1 FL=1